MAECKVRAYTRGTDSSAWQRGRCSFPQCPDILPTAVPIILPDPLAIKLRVSLPRFYLGLDFHFGIGVVGRMLCP